MIKPCTCYHPAQDKLHGKGMRVHNLALKGYDGAPGWRCTVCLTVKPVSAGERPIVKEAKNVENDSTIGI